LIDFNESKPFGSAHARVDLDAVVALLRDQAGFWVPSHFPSGQKKGKDWRVANIQGDAPYKQGSCAIKLEGTHAGDWYEFESSKGGGVLGTLGHATGLRGRFLIEYAAELSGWKVGDKKPPSLRPEPQTQNTQNEIRFILSGCRPAADTLVQTYLEARGLCLPNTQDILFHPDLAHWETKMGFPALVAHVRDAQGQVVGLHRIWLALDGKSKADVPKAKMMLGPVAGGAVRLGNASGEIVGIAEGIETGLAVAQGMPELPVWASLSTSGMEKLRLPPNIRRVILLADHDASGAGQKAAEATAERFVAEGRRVWIALPPKAGEDFNDLLVREGKDAVCAALDEAVEYKRQALSLTDTPTKRKIDHPPHKPFGFKEDAGGIKPQIRADDGDLARVADQCWSVLYASNAPPWLFRLSFRLAWVDLDDDARPKPQFITEDRMKFVLARQIDWRKQGKDKLIPAHPPASVIKDILATPHTSLPVLGGIVSTPVIGPDATILQEPGYHKAAKLIYVPQEGFILPAIAAVPSREDILSARDLLLGELLGDFPFTSDAERAHAMALLLLPFLRPLIFGSTPLHLIEKPTPGTGATLMVEAIAEIATGARASVLTEGRDEDEWRKRLTSALRVMPPLLFIDNLRARLDSAALAAAITAPAWEDRILGRSEIVSIPVRCAWVVTGNNPALSNEMARRAIRIRLDARVDQPWRRSGFRHENLTKWVRENRPRLVAACLTLAQGWIAAGRPASSQSLGSFEEWAHVIGGVLDFAGIPGFLGNLDDLYESSDAEGAVWRSFVEAWWERFESAEITASDLYQLTEDRDIPLPLGKGSEQSRRIRLGKQLGKMRDRVFQIKDGPCVTLLAGSMRSRALVWRLDAHELATPAKHSQHSFPQTKHGECMSVANQHSPQHSYEKALSDQKAGECSECYECFSTPYACARTCATVTPVKHSLTPPHSLTPDNTKVFQSECLSECQTQHSYAAALPTWLEGMADQFSPAMAEAIAAQTAPPPPAKNEGDINDDE
jgi:hypothetical protein